MPASSLVALPARVDSHFVACILESWRLDLTQYARTQLIFRRFTRRVANHHVYTGPKADRVRQWHSGAGAA